MTIRDKDRNGDFSSLLAGISRYFINIPVPCPYGLDYTAVYRQAVFACIPAQVMDSFLAAGYRRNGNCLYVMACPECQGCTPIRINPFEFIPNRNQKRVWRRNQDVRIERGPVQITPGKIDLCNRFFNSRYPAAGDSAQEYYTGFFMNSCTETFEVRYYREDRLTGVAIVDMGGRSLNVVYFFFDPDESRHSPGTFNILYLIDFCRRRGIGLLYLGYWIEKVRAMSYKTSFKPFELLINSNWISS